MWLKKDFPLIEGYESVGERGKRWLDFKINELLDTADPVLEYRHRFKSRKEICEFVITQFAYPLKFGMATDKHYNNWFSGLCCHKITLDYWQTASETLRTLHLNKRVGKPGYGDCEDTSVLFTTLMLQAGYQAYEIFGVVYKGDELLGGHGYAIFKDEEGKWRLFESTLDAPPRYSEGYPAVDITKNRWKVGDLSYEGWLMFNRKEYYEWEENGIEGYLKFRHKDKNSKKKHKMINMAWVICELVDIAFDALKQRKL